MLPPFFLFVCLFVLLCFGACLMLLLHDFVAKQTCFLEQPLTYSVQGSDASVMSNSLWPHGLEPTRLLCPWDSPGKKTGVGCHALLQGIFLTQWQNPRLLCLLNWQAGSFTTSATWEAHQRICWSNSKTITWSTLGRNIYRPIWLD